jgi:hypothetical protein
VRNNGSRILPGLAAAAALILLAVAASLVKARSYDLWWHLEAGEQIVSTFVVPHADDFSFTSAGAPWIDHEWLSEVLMYGFYAMGPIGLTLMKALCALAVAAIGYRVLRRTGAGAGAALAVVAASVIGLRFRLTERPEAITLVFAAALAALGLDLASRPSSPWRRLTGIGALTILWVNMHAGALLAPALALVCAAGAPQGRTRAPAPERVAPRWPIWCAVPLTALGLLVNPFGYRIYTVPSGIAEAMSPRNITNPEWAPPSWYEFPLFYCVLAVVAVWGLVRLKQRRPLAAPRLGIFLLAGGLAFSSLRHIGLFFALIPLMVDPAPARAPDPAPRRAAHRGWLLGASAVLAAAAWMLLQPPSSAAIGIGVQPGRFPEKAADFVEIHMKDARLYNDVAFGGYLIWRGYPGRRVFIDGRNEVHATLLRELAASVDDGRRWRALLDRHGVEGAVLRYRSESIPVVDAVTGRRSAGTFSELHFPRGDWALVYWDDVAMIYVARRGRFAAVAESLEYREARPEAWAAGAMDAAWPGQTPLLVEEIRRRLGQDPGCRLALAAAERYAIPSR